MTAGFTSEIAGDIQEFLAFKRTLGMPYRRAELSLLAFDRFVVAHQRPLDLHQLGSLMLKWLGRNSARKPVSVACELAVLRQLHLFMARRGRSGLSEPGWPKVPTSSTYMPHVFSETEVRTLLELTATMRPPPFRRIVYRALLLVLYTTGLRFGEALRLRLGDVDFARSTLFVTRSKGRARWVPHHSSLARELKRYAVSRSALVTPRPMDPFFIDSDGAALSVRKASDTIRRLLRAAGLKPTKGRVGPRPYDFRHAFAVHRLTRWYRAGVDLQARLPWLSAYMGHDDLMGTEAYLTATPELLSLAGERFRRRALVKPEPR